MAILLAIPLYLWNFAPHPFRPQPGESKAKWFMDVPFFLFLLVLELIGGPRQAVRALHASICQHGRRPRRARRFDQPDRRPAVDMGTIGRRRADRILHLAIQFLELFVAVLQAYIFTFLTTLFLASAVAPEH